MKKTLFVLLASVLLLALLSVPCFAEETDTEKENATETILEASKADAVIEKLTSASFWVTVSTSLLAALGVIATVKKNIDNIKSLVSKKADGETIVNALKTAKDEIFTEYNTKLAEVSKALEAERDENKKLTAILAIAFTNLKGLPDSTKAEIVALLNDVRKVGGTVAEIVSEAQEAIDKAEETATQVATPALDSLENYITMG